MQALLPHAPVLPARAARSRAPAARGCVSASAPAPAPRAAVRPSRAAGPAQLHVRRLAPLRATPTEARRPAPRAVRGHAAPLRWSHRACVAGGWRAGPAGARPKLTRLPQGPPTVTDDNVLEYCDINKGRNRTLGEKEQDFLMALQSFYDNGAWAAPRARPGAPAAAARAPHAPRDAASCAVHRGALSGRNSVPVARRQAGSLTTEHASPPPRRQAVDDERGV